MEERKAVLVGAGAESTKKDRQWGDKNRPSKKEKALLSPPPPILTGWRPQFFLPLILLIIHFILFLIVRHMFTFVFTNFISVSKPALVFEVLVFLLKLLTGSSHKDNFEGIINR